MTVPPAEVIQKGEFVFYEKKSFDRSGRCCDPASHFVFVRYMVLPGSGGGVLYHCNVGNAALPRTCACMGNIFAGIRIICCRSVFDRISKCFGLIR